MDINLGNVTRGVGHIASDALELSERGVKAVAKPATGFGHDALHVGNKVIDRTVDVAKGLGNSIWHLPQTLPTWKRVGQALVTGKRTLLPGKLPPYSHPAPAEMKAALERGAGKIVRQGFIRGAAKGSSDHEPVTMIVTGSLDDIADSLRSQGWVQNANRSIGNYAKQGLSALTRFNKVPEGPVSPMYLDGQLAEAAFSKNSDYNLARDHLRVFPMAKDPATGEPRWAIAATRDTAATVTLPHPVKDGPKPWDWSFRVPDFSHATDHDLDGERDLIMHDMLKSGWVKDWQAVKADPKGAKVSPAADGRLNGNQYVTDGKVFTVRLGQPDASKSTEPGLFGWLGARLSGMGK